MNQNCARKHPKLIPKRYQGGSRGGLGSVWCASGERSGSPAPQDHLFIVFWCFLDLYLGAVFVPKLISFTCFFLSDFGMLFLIDFDSVLELILMILATVCHYFARLAILVILNTPPMKFVYFSGAGPPKSIQNRWQTSIKIENAFLNAIFIDFDWFWSPFWLQNRSKNLLKIGLIFRCDLGAIWEGPCAWPPPPNGGLVAWALPPGPARNSIFP